MWRILNICIKQTVLSNIPKKHFFHRDSKRYGIYIFRQVCMRAKHFKYEEKLKRNESFWKQNGKNIKQNERKRK
jgi:hypothetical protein